MEDAKKGIIDSLLEMGFSAEKAEAACKATDYNGLQEAMEWIIAHEESDNTREEKETPPAASMQARSLKCEDCGKHLRNEQEAEVHAARTSHQNFSESTDEVKPLTKEEREAQLAKLEEKRKQKAAEREEKEKQEAISREKTRRKTGQEISAIKHKIALDEAKKIAEERRREKMEDRLARQRVKEQIAKDRADREAKPPEKTSLSQPTTAAPQQAASAPKKHSTCRLQVRCMDGSAKVETFQATDTFKQVLEKTGMMGETLMTTFPKRVYSSADSDKTLEELGLTPSAVLIQTQPKH